MLAVVKMDRCDGGITGILTLVVGRNPNTTGESLQTSCGMEDGYGRELSTKEM